MLDAWVRQYIDPPLDAMARILVKRGVRANGLTVLGLLFGIGAFIALAGQSYAFAILFIILSRLMDGLDGPLARQTQATDFGGYLDIVCDFIFYAGVVFFFALGRPEAALPAAFLIFSFMGSGSAFLAYAIFAAKRDLNHSRQGEKSFFYMSGLAEGTETNITLILICLLPAYFPWIAYIFGALCWLTTFGRILQARRDLQDISAV